MNKNIRAFSRLLKSLLGKQVLLLLIIAPLVVSCSINKLVIDKVSDTLSGSEAGAVFTGDDDLQLVGGALPFAVKMYEALLEQNPNHPDLIVMTGSLFIMYANAFVQGPAEMMAVTQYEEKSFQLERAKKLYLRGAAILERGINNKYPGMLGEWGPQENPAFTDALKKMAKEDVPLFYWYAAGTLSAYALDAFDITLGLRVPRITAIANKAYELEPGFNVCALDELFLLLYASLPDGMGGDGEKALFHYGQALEKSDGHLAGPYVSYAQTIAVKNQDYEAFKDALEKALAVDPAEDKANTLVNIIAQRKARYLLEKAPELFADLEVWDESGYDE